MSWRTMIRLGGVPSNSVKLHVMKDADKMESEASIAPERCPNQSRTKHDMKDV
jgi:hypothetical protein